MSRPGEEAVDVIRASEERLHQARMSDPESFCMRVSHYLIEQGDVIGSGLFAAVQLGTNHTRLVMSYLGG